MPDSVSINKFMDWTKDEYARVSGQLKKNKKKTLRGPLVGVDQTEYTFLSTDNLPASINWAEIAEAKIGGSFKVPIRNQGECGGCWAMTTAAAIEFYNWSAGGDFMTLSPQQLIDCTNTGIYTVETGNLGCDGGEAGPTFEYTKKSPLAQELYYPYAYTGMTEAQILKTHTRCGRRGGSKVPTNGPSYTRPYDKEQLKAAVAKGPVAVSLDASSDAFAFHKGTVPLSSRTCGDEPGHAVLAVGYGHYGRDEYLIIKNSHGAGWGAGGFGKISMNQ